MNTQLRELSDLCELIKGVTFSKSEASDIQSSNTIPIIRAGNIQEELLLENDLVFVPQKKVKKSQFIQKNDIIMCTSSGSIKIVGKCAMSTYDWIGSFGAFNICLRSKKNVDPKFLFYYLRSPKFKNWTILSSGANIKNIRTSELAKFQIPFPPLSTQQQIARILEQADALRKKTQQVIDLYDQLAQSIFLDMFGDPVINPKCFGKGVIRDLVSEVKYGTSSKADSVGDFAYLRMNNITYSGHMNFTDLKYICLDQKELSKYSVKRGDLLFNRTNSKELVGKTAVYNRDDLMVIAGYIIRVRMNDKGNPYFVWAYLNSRHGKLILKNMCKNIVGMANINAQELQDIKILLPPITLQNQFAEKISLIEKQKELAKQSLQESENLFNALLQKAFKGELVNSV